MAYYAALASVVQLLEDIVRRDRYQNLLVDKQQIASLYEKFSRVQALLDDYSPKEREEADVLERRIKDAAYRAQDIIECYISDQVYRKEKTHRAKRKLQRLVLALQKKFDNEGLEQEIASVCEKFSRLQVLLDDYSPKDREEADVLERRIRDAAYQAQDIIESYISDRVLWDWDRVLSDVVLPSPLDNQGLEKVKEQVDSIVEELLRIMDSQKTEDLPLNHYYTDAGTSQRAHGHADTNTMEGVEERLMMIKEQLCGEPSKLQVVSVMGMGGIGKTTLARNIFCDQLIVDRFDWRAWVTISQAYHQKKVLLDIIDSLKIFTDKSNGVGKLEEKIYKHLKGRRYLIIIDDIWETKVWDDIKRVLPNDSNGSRIMLTTRISNVAFYAGNYDFSHHMQTLNEEQSWNLFRKKVFCPPELENIGRLIAKNCGGLPLAIVVAAGLLSKVNKKRTDWEEIAKNFSSAATENDEHFSKILSLSYNHLPHHLKPLFLYIGGFPEDYEIPVSKLVKLWVAEGFLKLVESKSLEEVAEEYLEDLVKRNLILIIKKTFSGKIKYCGIHDVLRDLCTKIICCEDFIYVLHKDSCICPTTARNTRRIYIHRAQLTFAEAEKYGPDVRSIISLHHGSITLPFILRFRFLRVLDELNSSSFPSELLEFVHLRYLTLSINTVWIPPSISKLENLQTLILDSSIFGYTSLPSQVWEMPNLRHIMAPKLGLASVSEERIVDEPIILENLQTLSCVVDVSFTNEIIEMIPNLKKLKVKNYGGSRLWQRFHLKNLFHLRQLETLSIYFDEWCRSNTMRPFPESFAFPSNLNELSLKSCRIPWKDMTVVGSLPNLQVLKLKDNAFVGKTWESVEGEFPQLRFLLMDDLRIKYWRAENTHFPRLQRLQIRYCENLKEIPQEIGEIPTLELVEVEFSKLAALSSMKMQEEQLDMGNDVLQVRVHPQYRNFSKKESSESYSSEEEASENEEEIQEEALENKEEM